MEGRPGRPSCSPTSGDRPPTLQARQDPRLARGSGTHPRPTRPHSGPGDPRRPLLTCGSMAELRTPHRWNTKRAPGLRGDPPPAFSVRARRDAHKTARGHQQPPARPAPPPAPPPPLLNSNGPQTPRSSQSAPAATAASQSQRPAPLEAPPRTAGKLHFRSGSSGSEPASVAPHFRSAPRRRPLRPPQKKWLDGDARTSAGVGGAKRMEEEVKLLTHAQSRSLPGPTRRRVGRAHPSGL